MDGSEFAVAAAVAINPGRQRQPLKREIGFINMLSQRRLHDYVYLTVTLINLMVCCKQTNTPTDICWLLTRQH